jgi:hypothetical protein
MIRDGKREGWLKWPSSALQPWAELNGVKFEGISVGSVPGQPDRGTGVVAARTLQGGNEGPLMVIPGDIVLSLERVELQAKADKHLHDLLEVLGEYARVCNNGFFNIFPCLRLLSFHTPVSGLDLILRLSHHSWL